MSDFSDVFKRIFGVVIIILLLKYIYDLDNHNDSDRMSPSNTEKEGFEPSRRY